MPKRGSASKRGQGNPASTTAVVSSDANGDKIESMAQTIRQPPAKKKQRTVSAPGREERALEQLLFGDDHAQALNPIVSSNAATDHTGEDFSHDHHNGDTAITSGQQPL